MSTLPSSIKHLCIGILIFISSLVASAFLSSNLLYGQAVTFAGTQTTLPFSNLNRPYGIAVDSAGDVFIADTDNSRVVESPRTETGYGPQTTLPASGLYLPDGVAVDSAGDVFIADSGNVRVVELPKTATGYGPQTTVPASGLSGAWGVAVDSAGDLFIADGFNNRVVELPRTETGYGPQNNLIGLEPFSPYGIAVDSAGDVFIVLVSNQSAEVAELPRTRTGYGSLIVLPASLLYHPYGIAVDIAGDVFIADAFNNRVVELPLTATGYGPQTTLPTGWLDYPLGVAVDSAGDVIIADTYSGQALELQTRSVNFEGVIFCAPGFTTPVPCNETLTLNFSVSADLTLGTPKVLTGGEPNLDFTLASGSTCTGTFSAGATCTVNVTLAPLATGTRNGSVEIIDGSGNVLTTTLLSGFGQTPPTIDFSQGFGNASGELQFNGSTSLAGTTLELTNGGLHEASSAFYPTPVNVQAFTTDFTFQLTNPAADGFTFAIQNVGPGALGSDGGSLGYAGIGQSVAIKFDLFQNHGDPSNDSTGIYIDGALPIGPTSVDLTGSGINLHSGDPIKVHLTYDGTTLNLTLTDMVTWKSWSHLFAIEIPGTVGGDTAYVGFTGATGSDPSTQQILTWSYQAGQPLYYPKGFTSGSSLSMNGSASLAETAVDLTNREANEAGSAFYTTPVNIQWFTTDFNFKLTDAAADGFTFAIQNVGPNALGSDGASLGYAGIGNSVAVKFDLFQNAGDPSNDSTGIFVDGAGPIGPTSIDLNGTGINLHSGDTMDANLTYNGTTLTLTITDLVTQATWSHSFTINIPGTVGGNTAYVGFTGATGGLTSKQQIRNWTFE